MKIISEEFSPSARLTEWRESETGLSIGVLSSHPFKGTVLFKHAAPLEVGRTERIKANLAFRNDSYGYTVWELTLKGEGNEEPERVELNIIPPPSAPIPYTKQDFAEFRREFESRSSRFPDNSLEAFTAWQEAYREKLWAWLMGGSRPQIVAPETKWEPLQQQERFFIERMIYTSRPGRDVNALLALPKEASDKAVPLILALHGHETIWGQAVAEAFQPGHIDDFCHYFASNGFAVLQTPTMDHTLQNKNWTLYGEWVWDAMAGLNAVSERSEIDMTRVSIIGLSTGAILAELVAALDERPSSIVTAGIFSTWNHFRKHLRIPPHCDCGSSKYLAPYIEQCDILAIALPKFVQIQHGQQDHCFYPGADPAQLKLDWNTGVMPLEEFDAAVKEVKRAYKIAGVTDRFSMHIHPRGHAVDNVRAREWIAKAF